MNRKILVYILIWLVATGAFFLMGLGLTEYPKYKRLADYGVQTTGTVTGKEPENHQTVRYIYRVAENKYRGGGMAGGINSRFESLQAGDKVVVFYDPQKPQVSFLGDPKEQISACIIPIAMLTLFPTLAMVARKIKKRRVVQPKTH